MLRDEFVARYKIFVGKIDTNLASVCLYGKFLPTNFSSLVFFTVILLCKANQSRDYWSGFSQQYMEAGVECNNTITIPVYTTEK